MSEETKKEPHKSYHYPNVFEKFHPKYSWVKKREFRYLLELRLMKLRKECGYTVTFISNLLGCSRPQYERMERGENRFKDKHLVALASLYAVPVTELFTLRLQDEILRAAGLYDNPEQTLSLLDELPSIVRKKLEEYLTTAQNKADMREPQNPELVHLSDTITNYRRVIHDLATEMETIAKHISRGEDIKDHLKHRHESLSKLHLRLSHIINNLISKYGVKATKPTKKKPQTTEQS